MKVLYRYEEMPEDVSVCEGMRELGPDTDRPRARGLQDAVYAVKDGKELRLRIFVPQKTGESGPFPLILYVQGSGWGPQNLNDHLMDLAPCVLNGYAVAVTEYRESALAPFPAQILDAKTAVRFLAEHAAEYNIDGTRIILMGDSSGAHTVLGCYATWYDHRLDDETTELPELAGVVDLYGPTDLCTMGDYPSTMDHVGADSPEGMEIGGLNVKENPDRARAASIGTYMKSGLRLPPLLMLHGSMDRTVPFHQSLEFYEIVRSYGYEVSFYRVNGADHGGSAFYIPEVYERILKFLERCLGKNER